jgi:hypothetical protein
VLYDGGIGDAVVLLMELMEQMLSKKPLKSLRCEVRKVFIGSIHCSFWPKEAIFASV